MSEKFRVNLGCRHSLSATGGHRTAFLFQMLAHLFPHVVLNGERYKIAAGIKIGLF